VGTSTKWRGPKWSDLLGASRHSVRVIQSAARPEQMPDQRDGGLPALGQDWVADWGGRWLTRLHRDLQDDPEAYGLRSRAMGMGRGFVLAFEQLRDQDGDPDRMTVVGEFANRVVGSGTGVVDAVGRRAAVHAGDRLFRSNEEALFCLIYREFFADLVAEFLRAVIAEEIRFAVPALVLVDPSGQIADWVAGRLVGLVPDPCAAVVPGRTVLDVATEQVPAAVDAVLGLREQE
jgi:hypothetical protein